MSTNPFIKNDKDFTNIPPQPAPSLGNKSTINSQINGSKNKSQGEGNFFNFSQKKDANPFQQKIEPNSNNLNIQNNQNKNINNSFFLLNNQTNNEIKSSNNINLNQNNKNNTLLNINPNNNNTSQNTNIFNNLKGANNPLNINSINNNIKSTNNNIISTSTINTNKTKKEEKKEEVNIFLSQSNNILNKSNNKNSSQNNEEEKNNIISKIPNPEIKTGNIQIPLKEKKENQKVDDFINNLFIEDKIMFSEEERKKFEKIQLSHKSNEEIIDEFKYMLFNQKEKYEKLTNNSRIFGNKFINLINNIKNNSYEALNNEIRYKKLLEQIQLTEIKLEKLKSNMTNKDSIITGGLDYLKRNLNNNHFNSLSFIKNTNFEKNNAFYKEISETSDKIRKIDTNINLIGNSIGKNEDNKNDIKIIYNKEKGKEDYFNKMNNNIEGIFIERNSIENNNSNNKIYLEQKEMDNIFTECYDGLYSLKCKQDEFNDKYNKLKNKLIKKIKQNSNNFGKSNIRQEDLNL